MNDLSIITSQPISIALPREDDSKENKITLQAKTLYEEPIVHIESKDQEGNILLTEIAYHIAKDLNETLFEAAYEDFVKVRKEARRALHNPSTLSEGIVPPYHRLPNTVTGRRGDAHDLHDFLVRGEDLDAFANEERYIPYLSWGRDHSLSPLAHGYWDTWDWRLELTGFRIGALAYADWDDREGILSLINAMNDREALMVEASLQQPDESARVATLYNLQGILNKCRKDALQNLKDLVDIFNESKILLASERHYPSAPAHVSVHYTVMDDDDVAIAYGINIPDNPEFQGSVLKKISAPFTTTSNKHLQSHWNNVFREEAQSRGWLIVEDDLSPYKNHIWLTKLSNEGMDPDSPTPSFVYRLRNSGSLFRTQTI